MTDHLAEDQKRLCAAVVALPCRGNPVLQVQDNNTRIIAVETRTRYDCPSALSLLIYFVVVVVVQSSSHGFAVLSTLVLAEKSIPTPQVISVVPGLVNVYITSWKITIFNVANC